jgi:competence protein ComGC
VKYVLEFVATLCTSIFAGASLYITFVEHPARMQCGTEVATAEFGPSYRRATAMQASLAIGAFLAAVGAWWLSRAPIWLIGGVLIGAVVPFTLIVILPTNKKLLDPGVSQDPDLAGKLLSRWGKLHAVRTVLSAVALVVLLRATALAAQDHIVESKEGKLRQDLFVLREEIQQYTLDKQKEPQSLDDLIQGGYIREIPKDPITGKADWIPDMDDAGSWLDQVEPGIWYVHSRPEQTALDGTKYSDW